MTDTQETTQTTRTDHATSQDLLDCVIATYETPADLIRENGLHNQLTKAVVEGALNAEVAEDPGHDRHVALHLNAHASSDTLRSREEKRFKFLCPLESFTPGAGCDLAEELEADTHAAIVMLPCQTDVGDCLHGI
jgi:hypothetical protein